MAQFSSTCISLNTFIMFMLVLLPKGRGAVIRIINESQYGFVNKSFHVNKDTQITRTKFKMV